MFSKRFEKKAFKAAVKDNVKTLYRKTIDEATPQQLFQAVSYAVKDVIIDDWIETQKRYDETDAKTVYYMSMEFLMGRALGNNLINMTAYKDVKAEEPYFKGHFPGNPIMPGVLIVESLAQTGAVAILSQEENKGRNALFGGVDKLKFKKQVIPGDRLKLEVKIIKRKGPIGVGEAIATVDGKIAVKGELTFAIV